MKYLNTGNNSVFVISSLRDFGERWSLLKSAEIFADSRDGLSNCFY